MKRTFWIVVLSAVGIAMPLMIAVPAGHARQGSAAEGHGLNLADLDRTCKPCDDFYRFVNGGWLATHPIPAAYASYGHFTELQEKNQEVLHRILEETAAQTSAKPGSVEQKIGDFYSSCMNSAQSDSAGLHPLEPEFTRIAAVSDSKSLQTEVAHLHAEGISVMFRFGSTSDFKNSSEQTGSASQGGLSLPNRDYYTKTDDRSQQLRDAYRKNVEKTFTLAGDSADRAAAEAGTVLEIETKLAGASLAPVDMRNPETQYHRMGVADLAALTPHFDWRAYFRNVGFPNIAVVNVGQPDFFKQLDARLGDISLDDWKTYMRWHVIHASAPNLSAPFVDENFDFFGRTLTGAKENQPLWKRCVAATDRALGDDLGQKYVEKEFPPEAKARALEMVHNLIAALHDDLQTLAWMSPETRKQALIKLDSMTIKIGYPDKWRDYSALHVDRGPFVVNMMHNSEFTFHRSLDRIGKPVDRAEWGMTPPTVNASYNPSRNDITFPAGILQAPFFDAKADDALNYGGMGAVIGHEMTHGFDDEGRKFDGQGNLRDWWTAEDAKNFEERAECVSKQFDGYVVEGDLHENGKLILGESIADLGGLTIAYNALEKAIAKKPHPAIDGFTPEQRFFISWGRVWGTNDTPQFDRLQVNTNPHPLGKFRAIAAPSNLQPFAQAFDCKNGDPMVRQQPCRIW
jgi:predicted metalloendopeptidase